LTRARRRNRPDLAKYREQLARAIEPVIGHLKDHHRMGRNYFAHASGDAINAVLAAAGYNFRRLVAWLRLFVAQNPDCARPTCSSSNPSEIGFFTADNSSLILSSRTCSPKCWVCRGPPSRMLQGSWNVRV
jgi:IS5 family transposase